jgi:bifunctional DNase/RNase
MPQKFLSPGVETVEVDQTFVETGTPSAGALLIGRTPEGRAFFPVGSANFDQFRAALGDLDPLMQVTYAAKNHLKNSTTLTTVRVLGHADATSTTNGYSGINTIGIIDTSGTIGVTGSVLAVLHTTMSMATVSVSGVAGDANRFTVRFGTLFAATASFLTSSDDYIGKVLNTDPTKHSRYGHYVYQTFPYKKQASSASWYAVGIASASFTTFTRDYDHGVTMWVKSQVIGGMEFDLLRFHDMCDGRASNDRVKVTVGNIKPPLAPSVYPYGSFDVYVRSFYDSDARPVVLETYAQCNFDPNSPNYVLRRIGDRQESFDTATRKFQVTKGTYPNMSSKVWVELNTDGDFPPGALPWGFRGYPKQVFSGSGADLGGAMGASIVPNMPYTPDQYNPNGNVDPNIVWGVSFVSGGIADRMRAMPDGALLSVAGVTGSDADFSLRSLSGTYINGQLQYQYNSSYSSYAPIYSSASLQAFTMPFWGGFDGWDLRVSDPLYLNTSAGMTDIGVVSLKRALDAVKNPDVVDGNVLAIPAVHNVAVTDYAREVVNKRKDMLFIMDLTGSTPNQVVGNLNARQIDDNYSAGYYPDVVINDKTNSRRFRAAPSTVVVGALAYTDRVAQAFFAPAGMNRGGLSQFGVDDIVDRIDHDDRDMLYENRINPITKFPGEGVVIFGQKTLQLRPSALDRVNVRRLLILAKRAVVGEARELVFEPNNGATWTKFVNKVNPILDTYRKDQGINRFKVVMDQTTNTSDVVDRNEMRGKIFLEPVRAAEYITIDFVITPSGVEFGS